MWIAAAAISPQFPIMTEDYDVKDIIPVPVTSSNLIIFADFFQGLKHRAAHSSHLVRHTRNTLSAT
jgi:hypothetical protein